MSDTIFTMPGSISNEKYNDEKERSLMWKIANIVAFSSTKPCAANLSPLKTCILYRNVQVFV